MELSKNKASVFASLSNKKMRQKHGLFIAEGSKCVFDTLGAFALENLIATKEWLFNNHLPECVERGKILTAEENVIRKISTMSTAPEILAVFRLPDDEAELTLDPNSLYLMLDGIQDPGNMGTIIRTADWFGFKEVICSKETVDVYNPKVVQATMGSLKRVKVIYTDIYNLLKANKIRHIYGTLLDGEDIFKKKLEDCGVIVMGNEGNGLTPKLRGLVTDPLFIPPANPDAHPESLNVAIATALTIAQFCH